MSEERDKPAEQDKPAARHQKPTAPLNPRIAVLDTSSAKATTEEEQWRRRQEELLAEQVKAAKRLNCITAAATGVTLLGLIFLWGTLNATKDAADAAKTAATLAQLTTVAEVTNSEASLIKDGETILTFINTGKTKATNVRAELFYCGYNAFPPDFDPFTMFAKLGDTKIDELQQKRDEDLRRFEKLHLPESEMNAVRENWETIMRQAPHRVSLPPAYVMEIPANTPVLYYVPVQQNFAVTFVFGKFRYDDELRYPHKDNRLCWRFESNRVTSCLMFRPIK